MNSKTLKRKDFLNLLAKSRSAKRRKQIIDVARPEDISAVSECALNLLKNNIPLSDKNFKKFYKCKHNIRNLARKRTSLKKKKLIIHQKGGFLQYLIPLAIASITELVKKIKEKKKKVYKYD